MTPWPPPLLPPDDTPSGPARDLRPWLIEMLGPHARFRPGQQEAIEAVLEDGARVLVVQKTGWGKSIVYTSGNLSGTPCWQTRSTSS
jgi:hypothetical protein